jgi:hypothetical protein
MDQDARTAQLYSDPDPDVGYGNCRTAAFGVTLMLPGPLGIELDTEKLKDFSPAGPPTAPTA